MRVMKVTNSVAIRSSPSTITTYVDVLKLLNTHAPQAIVFKGKSYATVLRIALMAVTKENPVATKTSKFTTLRNVAATNRPNSHVLVEISA
jgi:hypothetical protein